MVELTLQNGDSVKLTGFNIISNRDGRTSFNAQDSVLITEAGTEAKLARSSFTLSEHQSLLLEEAVETIITETSVLDVILGSNEGVV